MKLHCFSAKLWPADEWKRTCALVQFHKMDNSNNASLQARTNDRFTKAPFQTIMFELLGSYVIILYTLYHPLLGFNCQTVKCSKVTRKLDWQYPLELLGHLEISWIFQVDCYWKPVGNFKDLTLAYPRSFLIEDSKQYSILYTMQNKFQRSVNYYQLHSIIVCTIHYST